VRTRTPTPISHKTSIYTARRSSPIKIEYLLQTKATKCTLRRPTPSTTTPGFGMELQTQLASRGAHLDGGLKHHQPSVPKGQNCRTVRCCPHRLLVPDRSRAQGAFHCMGKVADGSIPLIPRTVAPRTREARNRPTPLMVDTRSPIVDSQRVH